MAPKLNQDDYRLKLSGCGISIDRLVTRDVARKIMNLVMADVTNGDESDNSEDSSGTSGGLGRLTTPKAFMAAKRPTTDIERITSLAFYLTHRRNMPRFKTKDLAALNMEAAQPRMSNPSFAARNATNQQYLSLAGGGTKQITARGEAIVKALPDRDAIKNALEAHKIARRRRTRRAAKR